MSDQSIHTENLENEALRVEGLKVHFSVGRQFFSKNETVVHAVDGVDFNIQYLGEDFNYSQRGHWVLHSRGMRWYFTQ